MKKISIVLAALLLASCAGQQVGSVSDRVPQYADSLYAIARVSAVEAVRLGHLSPEKFAEIDGRAQLMLASIHLGTATIEQLIMITNEMRASRLP